MRVSRRAASLVFVAAFALWGSVELLGAEGGEPRVVIHPDALVRGVSVPFAFKGEGGKAQPPGLYDLKLRQGTPGILVGLLRNGKQVAEVQGRYFNGFVSRFSAGGRAADPPGGATQGHDISIRTADRAQDVHFGSSSRVAFGAGGAGKVFCTNNLRPGAILPYIEFLLLPAVQVQK